MKKKSLQVSFWIFLFIISCASCVNVHFENKDGGFFLKQLTRQHFQTTSESTAEPSQPDSAGSPLSVDRFTVFQSSQPISVRATYGPFSTKQTVPARYVVPDPIPLNTSGQTIDLQDLASHHLDMSAHIVRNEIPRDFPVLRVLFHTGTDPGGRRQLLLNRHHQKVCIVLHAAMGTHPPLTAACSPEGEDGVCLAQITVPASYWPALPSPDKNGRMGKPAKSPPRLLQVSYSVLEPRPDEEEACHPNLQVQPSTTLGVVPLVQAKGAYKELKLTDSIMMLVPHPALYPLARMHIPVFIDREKAKLMTAIVVRARVKSGIKILEAVAAGAAAWNVSVDINPRHTGASVTLVRREPPDTDPSDGSSDGEVIELFSWLLEISEDATELYDGTKIVWTARFEPHQDQEDTNGETHRIEAKKSATRFEVQKDDIQAVVPISKNWEVLNTAVLTGKQVSQAMKVFIVSQAGKAADVTFQASCHSEDDSVLKVSSSCSSVYVDGSEARGSVNGSVLVKYGTYTGLARFTVWMPEFPLDLQVSDTKLSQIKSWRVPDYAPSVSKIRRRKKRFYANSWAGTGPTDDIGGNIERPMCRLRYQQSPVEVYAHFMATDHDSGRVSYLINRRTWLRVTDLVLPQLRVSDPRIASLHGRILQGRSMGRTEVQVLSPITGRVIGAKEIRVGNDKVGITKLSVQVVSGLQLNILPDSSIENGYIAETSVTRKLTAQYQEGLLDIELEFSDGSHSPLREISDNDYHLVVESLDPEVVAFAPMVASHHPRVIAVGEGSGDLLQVTLLLSEECRAAGRLKMKGLGPLSTAAASVSVDFSSSDLQHRPDILQNDGGAFGAPKGGIFQDLQDILKGNAKDSDQLEPNVQARQYSKVKGHNRIISTSNMTPLEISMYVLLATFLCAIVVFVASCVVYASKFKETSSLAGITEGVRAAPINLPNETIHFQKEVPRRRETTTNAHDWVWLGRATMDSTNRNSTVTQNGSAVAGTEMRITTNPLNANYVEPDDCLATSFSNPNHIELPSGSGNENGAGRVIDSTTYCRSKMSGSGSTFRNDTPPPLPPHGIPPPQEQSKIALKSPEDYRPPVPPHRNIASAPISTENTPQRKHHHHHHHRNSKNHKSLPIEDVMEYNRPSDPTKVSPSSLICEEFQNRRSREFDSAEEGRLRSVFEFDDEPLMDVNAEAEPQPQVVLRQKPDEVDNNDEFVLFSKANANGNVRNSAEVKKATIVGNPMFSTEDPNNKTELERAGVTPLPGLDDLQLDMDYEQIMNYFENLKESNA